MVSKNSVVNNVAIIKLTIFGKYCHRGLLNACGTFVKRSVIGLVRGKRKPIAALF